MREMPVEIMLPDGSGKLIKFAGNYYGKEGSIGAYYNLVPVDTPTHFIRAETFTKHAEDALKHKDEQTAFEVNIIQALKEILEHLQSCKESANDG